MAIYNTTTDRFLRGVKRRISHPNNPSIMTDDGILEIADDMIISKVVPMIMSANQEYFVVRTTQSTVANQAEYDFPKRALAQSFRDLKLKFDDGSTRDLPLVALEDEHMTTLTSSPAMFYFLGDKYALSPAPTVSTMELEEYWYIAPSKLVTLSSASKVLSISGGDVTVDAIPSTITSGVDIDFIKGNYGNSLKGMDIEVQGASGSIISFNSSDVPSDLEVGDYISVAGTSPVVRLPDVCIQYAETLTSVQVLQSIDDFEMADIVGRDLEGERKDCLRVIDPRIFGESTKIINRGGLMRGRRSRYIRGSVF